MPQPCRSATKNGFRTAMTLGLLAVVTLLAGCGGGGYVMHGKVVRGPDGFMSFVAADDDGLNATGIPGVKIEGFRDPDHPAQHRVGKAMTGHDGTFTLALDEFGSGWMAEDWEIRCSRRQFSNVSSIERLPSESADRQLLIQMRAGYSDQHEYRQEDDLYDQYERYR